MPASAPPPLPPPVPGADAARSGVPDDDVLTRQIAEVAAGEASNAEEAAIRALASADPRVAVLLAEAERLERMLRLDSLVALPLGLVSSVLARVSAEPFPTTDAASYDVARRDGRSPIRWAAMAAAALLALGAGIGGLWTATTSDGLLAIARPGGDAAEDGRGGSDVVALDAPISIVDVAAAARGSASATVRSLVTASDDLPGSPTTLGAGALVLLGAAVVGARRQGFAAGRTSAAFSSGARSPGTPSSGAPSSGAPSSGERSSIDGGSA